MSMTSVFDWHVTRPIVEDRRLEALRDTFKLLKETLRMADRIQGSAKWFTSEFKALRRCIQNALDEEVGMERRF